jgi:hypothetical protein
MVEVVRPSSVSSLFNSQLSNVLLPSGLLTPMSRGINGPVSGTVAGSGACKVVSDLVTALCCLEHLNIDFQQANGRNVDVGVAMGLWCQIDEVSIETEQNLASSVIGCRLLIIFVCPKEYSIWLPRNTK